MTMKRRLMMIVGIIAIMIAMLLWCGTASAEGGTFDGIDWDLTNGVLTLGKADETQTLVYNTRVLSSWPWNDVRSEITAINIAGPLIFRGSMYYMFSGCSQIKTIDLSLVELAEDAWRLDNMFSGCSSLETVIIPAWNMHNVTTCASMFRGCSSLVSIDLSGWHNFDATGYNGNGRISLSSMFEDCSSLISLDLSAWDTTLVGSMSSMFKNCVSLETIVLDHWDTHNVTSMVDMFRGCSSLGNVDVSHFDLASCSNISDMFLNCSALEIINVGSWSVSNVTNMSGAFYGCENVSSLDVSNWEVSSVQNMLSMFQGCASLSVMDLSDWDMSEVTTMTYMFQDCTNLTDLDLSGWNTNKLRNMDHMFDGCRQLKQLNVTGWDTSNVTSMVQVFRLCDSIEELDLSDWDTSNVTTMQAMFYHATNLKMLNISRWYPIKVTNTQMILTGCSSLCEVILGENNPFICAMTTWSGQINWALPASPYEKDGIAYTGKWIREDGTVGPYYPAELRDNYTSAMAGKWVWEKVPTEYSITFVCTENGYLGDMPPVTVEASEDYTLPGNAFRVFGYEFDHWMDSTGRIWMDKDSIPANTYAVNAEVILIAVFTPRDTFIVMQDGAFDFSIKADEKALFSPILASTAYQVYEQTPFGWNLIAQTDASGVIAPDAESEALFLNKYDPLKVTVRFAGTKLMDGSVAEVDSFNFLLYEDETLIDIASVSEGGAIEFQPIEYNVAGDHHYYIKEVISSDNTVDYDTHVEEIMVSITSDGVGHLSADVIMDEDEILFKNESKPGMLVLQKLNATTDDRDGVFYYEVQFSAENGQPYGLLSSDISYEEREGDISEFPEVQPQLEKPKYTLTVQHYTLGEGLQPSSTPIRRTYLQCQAGDIATIEDAGIAYYKLGNVDSGAVQSANGKYQLLMPNHDLTVNAYYDRYQNFGTGVVWNGYDTSRPTVNIDVYGNGKYLGTAVNSGSSVYINVPVYDASGNPMAYETEINGLPDDYYVRSTEKSYSYHRYFINTGFQAYAIWDDYDDYYGQRPSNVTCYMASDEGLHYTFSMSSDADYMYPFAYRDGTSHDATYWVDITAPSCPRNYAATTYLDDPIMDPHTIKFTLTSMGINGSIVWDDDDNSSGIRPSAITVYVMKDGNPVTSQLVRAGSTWSYSINGLELADNYTVSVDDIEGYTTSIDGTTITFTKIPTAEIMITDVTLLSKGEYGEYRDLIPLNSTGWWWLRSSYSDVGLPGYAGTVTTDGSLSGANVGWATVDESTCGVRPILVCDLSSSIYQAGTKISLADHTWTVLSDSIILCDDIVGHARFNESPYGDDNVYATSYIKAWLENWAIGQGIMLEKQFEITDVTLLSKEEYNAYRTDIPSITTEGWWLRSPGYFTSHGSLVYISGETASTNVDSSQAMRPAIICDLTSSDLVVGDKVSLAGCTWTVISISVNVINDPYNGKAIILCDEFVGHSVFRTDASASDANDYDASDMKQWLANWVATHPFWTKTVTATLVQ